jgi:hypothetical protein
MKKYILYKFNNNDIPSTDRSALSKKIKSFTGFYADEYIKPVIKEQGRILNLIVDESKFRNNYCVSAIIIPYLTDKALKAKGKLLTDLIKKYEIPYIHFTDIFGKKRILKDKKKDFLKEYIEIVKDIPMAFKSISIQKKALLHQLQRKDMPEEEIYFILFWNVFEHIALTIEKYSVITIYKEQEYSLQKRKDLEVAANKLFTDLYSGLEQVFAKEPKVYISVCKHPHFFTKHALLYSSLSDFNAYSTNKIQNKIDEGVPTEKIIKEHSVILKMIKDLYKNYSGLPSKEFIDLLKSV